MKNIKTNIIFFSFNFTREMKTENHFERIFAFIFPTKIHISKNFHSLKYLAHANYLESPFKLSFLQSYDFKLTR